MSSVMGAVKPLWLQMREAGFGAKEILRHFGISYPAVPVEAIAERMEVFVHRIPGPGYDGALQSSHARADIWVDSNDAKVRQRFTIAHELGHLMLHPLGRVWRDATNAQHWTDPKEVAANKFAAELLMPAWMIKPYLSVGPDALADFFSVSRAAMQRRLTELQ